MRLPRQYSSLQTKVIADSSTLGNTITFAEGDNTTITVSGQTLTFSSAAGGNGGSGGIATIYTGSVSTTINHGLDDTPLYILISPMDDIGGRNYWSSDITASSFVLNISGQDLSSHSFSWYANN